MEPQLQKRERDEAAELNAESEESAPRLWYGLSPLRSLFHPNARRVFKVAKALVSAILNVS